jgi:hypothetical protein
LFALINPITHPAQHFLTDVNLEARFDQDVKNEKVIRGWAPAASASDAFDPYELAAKAYQAAILIFLYALFNGVSPSMADLYAKVDGFFLTTLYTLGSLPPCAHIRTTIM